MGWFNQNHYTAFEEVESCRGCGSTLFFELHSEQQIAESADRKLITQVSYLRCQWCKKITKEIISQSGNVIFDPEPESPSRFGT